MSSVSYTTTTSPHTPAEVRQARASRNRVLGLCIALATFCLMISVFVVRYIQTH